MIKKLATIPMICILYLFAMQGIANAQGPVDLYTVYSNANNGNGTLQQCAENHDGSIVRICQIMFSGVATITSEIKPVTNTLIFGCSAPGKGAFFKTGANKTLFRIENPNVHIRCLTAAQDVNYASQRDVITCQNTYNVTISQSSFYWGTDEIIGVSNCHNFTISNSILGMAIRTSTGDRGVAMLITNSSEWTHVTGNYFVHNHGRNPECSSKSCFIVGNTIYNFGTRSGRGGDNAEITYQDNIVKFGPHTHHVNTAGTVWYVNNPSSGLKVAITGQVIDEDNYQYVEDALFDPNESILSEHRNTSYTQFHAFGVGNTWWLHCDGTWSRRVSEIDRQLYFDYVNSIGPTLDTEMDDPSDYGGFPYHWAGTGDPCTDSDSDGLPDEFEMLHPLLNPNFGGDVNLGIEDYLSR